MRRKEKLTLWPNCLPFPVSSQRAAISLLPLILTILAIVAVFILYVKGVNRYDDCYNGGMSIDFVYIAIVLGVILFSMTLHEVMHGFVAYWLGDDTAKAQGRLTFNPLKHIDPFMTIILPVLLAISGLPIFGGAKPVPFNPHNVRWGEWGAALVALAGPLVNLIIAFLSFGLWVVVGSPVDGVVGQIFAAMVSVNLGFFIFNLIPVPPLDGSRFLYALAPDFIKRGMEIIERYGIFVVFGLVLIAGPALGAFMVAIINFFISVFSHIFII